MSDLTGSWHFLRPDPAFDLALTAARSLFPCRRVGKSEFLTYDLLPAAVGAGYFAAYTNL
jgi:hypothetical protein